jgi:phosphoribosylformylglycinamidine cyclo-ligase
VATYRDAGVDIDAGDRAVELMKASIGKASRSEVVGAIGGFSGLFDASALKNYTKPLLATSTDGVGTKTEIARQMGIYDTIGEDLVAMVVDDLVVCGAEPLFMTDYIAVGKVIPERIAEIVKGIASGCVKANTALIGGETAEHPGLLGEDEFDIAGAATGVVDAPNLLSAEKVRSGDLLLAMPSSGFHSNGYSLIRHILSSKDLDLGHIYQDLGKSLGEELLTPTEIYTRDCLVLIKALGPELRTFAHITGGGLANNTARVIPPTLCARFDRSTWALPISTQLLAQLGGISQDAFEGTWNCGVGMVAVVAPESADLALNTLSARGMHAWIAGEVGEMQGLHGAILEGSYQAR